MTDHDEHDEAQPEADTRALPGHRVLIYLEGQEEPLGPVRITNRDRVAWDKTAPRKKWGAASEVPFLAATFCAWNAAKRQGLTELSLAAWEDAVEEVETVPEDESDTARPTRRGAVAASS